MPRSTPRPAKIEDALDHDLSLGSESPGQSLRTAADYTATDIVRGVLIYTHGCSVRVRFKVAPSTVLATLPRCGWSEDPAPSIWKASKPGAALQRYVLRGSKWLDERPPSNGKLPLTALNREWRTRIYSLAIERKGETFHVDLQVVRYGDIRRFMEEVLGLNSADWEIAYYRAVERYMTVPPHVALRLAEGIGALPTVGRGRQARKRWLVRDYPIPITVRTSAKATATLVVYRIERGATAHYRVEVRLRGKRQDRGQFHAADAERLDDLLLDLVKTYGLTTKPSPARWEPRTFTTPIERGAFDECVRRLPQKAWRGTRISNQLKRTVRGCHTPSLVKCVVGSGQGGTFRRPVRIRRSISSPAPPPSAINEWTRMEGEGFEVARYVPEDQEGLPAEEERSLQRDPYASTAEDIARSGLYIHEVILDPGEDPRRLVDALAAGPLGTIGVAALCAVDRADRADTWLSVIEATNDYPVDAEGIETVVLVIDPTAVMDVLGAIVGGDEPEVGIDGAIVGDLDRLVVDGPLAPPIAGMDVTHKAMAGWLADMLRELRQLGEQTGMRIVLVTCDSRPQHAYGNLQRTHFFRDARVRSSIGDAGRYFAHQRYRIERAVKTTYRRPYITLDETEDGETIFEEHLPYEEHEYVTGSVVVIKDEAEGLPGRLLYGSSGLGAS